MAGLNNTLIRGSLRVISDFYADTIYEGGTALSNKYLQLSGGTVTGETNFTGSVTISPSVAGVRLGVEANTNACISVTSPSSNANAEYIDLGKTGTDYTFRIIKWENNYGSYNNLAQMGYDAGHMITIPNASGTFALTSDIPSSLPANGGNSDTVDGYHAGVNNGQVATLVPFPGIGDLKNAGYLTSEYGSESYGYPDDVFLQAICRWCINTYVNIGDITLMGVIAPNSTGTCIIHLYSSSGKDSNNNPRYCAGIYQNLNGRIYQFGFVDYVWFYAAGARTSDLNAYLPLSGGTMSGNITLGSGASGQTQVGANLIMGIQNDSYGLLPYAHNWNQIGADGRYWYRAFISNIYATTIYENGTSLVDKYLGINSNAISASIPYGFSGRTTSAGWTSAMDADGYTNMITGWQDSYSGDIAFKDNGNGALSCEIDGYFYQGCDGHGSSRVMDNYDRTHLQWGDADTVDGYHASSFLNTSGGTIGGNLTLTTSSSVALKVLVNQPQGLQGSAYAKLTTTDDSYPEGRLELANYAGSATKYTPSGIIIGSYTLSYPSLSANRTIATTADITTVVANPSGSATATLSSIQIGSTVYSLPTPSGSSGVSSIGGATGAITLGGGLSISNNQLIGMGINGGTATTQFNLLGYPNADVIIRSQGQSNTIIGADVGNIILMTNISNGGYGVLLNTNSVSAYYSASFPNKAANSNETIAMVSDIPSSLPANGGNADTVDNKHASDFLPYMYKATDVGVNNLTLGVTSSQATQTGQYGSNHSVFLHFDGVGTPFQLQIPDASESYIYKRYNSGGTWSGWSKISAGYADSAGSAGSVAWANVSGHPTDLGDFTNNAGYITGITSAMVTNALGYTPPTTDHTYNFAGTTFNSGNASNCEHNANDAVDNGVYWYNSNGPSTSLGASVSDGALYVQSWDSNWVAQIAQDYRNGRLFVRGKNNGTWQDWKRIAQYDEIPSLSGYATESWVSNNFLSSSGKAADADLLDGHNSSYFINTSNISNQDVRKSENVGYIDARSDTSVLPISNNVTGRLKIVLCSSEPAAKYDGYIYLILS